MSVQNALEFINRLIDDEDLYLKVKNVERGNLDALRTVAQDAGFGFSADDWQGALDYRRPKAGELADEALETVAGGALTGQMGILLPTALQSFMDPLGKSACKACKSCSKCKKIVASLPAIQI